MYDQVKCILLDIEGTVCPISFVKDILFPYALKALPKVLEEHWNDAEFAQYRDAFPTEFRTSPAALQAHVEDLTRRDVKIGYLKNLQGYLWETGYKTGAYTTPLFPDVAPQLSEWQRSSLTLAIYSSGSVSAQKMLFAHVESSPSDGKSTDMTSLISAWFDTLNAGPKLEASSYTRIAKELNYQPCEILFFSDNVAEVAAALETGLEAIVVIREGNAPLSDEDRRRFTTVTALNEISLSPARIDARFWKR